MANSAEILNRVAASVPVNRTASTVVSAGVTYVPGQGNDPWFADCPLLQLIPWTQCMPPEFKDLTGRTQGLMRVVGLSAEKQRWVCRCVCGRFCMRKACVINRPWRGDNPDCCAVCLNAVRLRGGRKSIFKAVTA